MAEPGPWRSGTMADPPVLAERPGCWRCVWVLVGDGLWRLKMVSGSCHHAGISHRPWDAERYAALGPTGVASGLHCFEARTWG
jgi:hypothetical protein